MSMWTQTQSVARADLLKNSNCSSKKDDFESDEETMETEQSGPMLIFNMKNLLTSPFVHLSDEIEEEQ